MKKFLVLIGTILITGSCVSDKGNERTITVSILPFKYFTEAIVGDHYRINVVVPPGASPATYEPTPSVVDGIRRSDAIIFDGFLGFELAWMERLKSVNPKMKTVVMADGIDLISSDSHRHGEHMHYSGVDPHFWMSPQIAIQLSGHIKDMVTEIDPANAGDYEQNWIALLQELNNTKAYLDSILVKISGSSFMIFHPALSYLAREYGLNQMPVEVEGKEPSPSDLKKFIDQGREGNIRIIFVQREFDRKNAMTIARELDAGLMEIDPLSVNWHESIRYIATQIANSYSMSKKSDQNE